MAEQQPFKWRHFEAPIMLLCVRWYRRSSLRSRDREEMMQERGLQVDHTTISRWVPWDAPELEKRCRPPLKTTTDSWRVDETSRKIKGTWMDLSLAVDSQGSTLEFLLSTTREAQAARCVFAKALGASQTVTPRVRNVEKKAASPKAFREFQGAGTLPALGERRQNNSLNNLVEHDHRFLKRLVKPGLGFFSFETAWRTFQGYEVMNMMRKGQVQGGTRGDCPRQAAFMAELFGVAISTQQKNGEAPFFLSPFVFLQHSRLRWKRYAWFSRVTNRRRRSRSTPVGAKGIGEIGIIGTAAAIANAVFHATGIRVRDLPLSPEKLLTSLPH